MRLRGTVSQPAESKRKSKLSTISPEARRSGKELTIPSNLTSKAGIGMPRIFAVKEQRASASVQAPRNSDRIKRVNEVAIACACIAFTLPLLLIIALAIRIESPGPILVCHERIGAGGRRLRLFKFRTRRMPQSWRAGAEPAKAPGSVSSSDLPVLIGCRSSSIWSAVS